MGLLVPTDDSLENQNAISVIHPEASTGPGLNALMYAGPAAAAWSASNRSFYVPFQIAAPMVVASFVYYVGTASGNVDIGITDAAGTLLTSTGSTAASGSSAMTRIGIADYTLPRAGTYFLAMAADNTTLTIFRWSMNVAAVQTLGVCAVSSNFPLASQTLTSSSLSAYTYLPLFGFFTKDLDP